MPWIVSQTVFLLCLSNLFMTVAWDGHLKTMGDRPWYVAAMLSWASHCLNTCCSRLQIELFTMLSLPQLKITREVISIGVFIPFAVLVMKQPLKLDFLRAGFCLLGAVYFTFRS